MIRNACSFDTYLMPPGATYGLWVSCFATSFFWWAVTDRWKYTFTTSSFFTWFDQETVQLPRAMKSPSRNIPISTVIVAAIVVEAFAPSDRHASEKSSL